MSVLTIDERASVPPRVAELSTVYQLIHKAHKHASISGEARIADELVGIMSRIGKRIKDGGESAKIGYDPADWHLSN